MPDRTCFCAILSVFLTASPAILRASTPAGDRALAQGRAYEEKAQWDEALAAYTRALAEDPAEPAYRTAVERARVEDARIHVARGLQERRAGHLDRALEELAAAHRIDPASTVAEKEWEATRGMTGGQAPPALAPAAKQPLTLRMNGQAPRVLFQTLGTLAGIDVLFDPDYQSGPNVNVTMRDVTVGEALDYIAILTRSSWKALSPTSILVTNQR